MQTRAHSHSPYVEVFAKISASICHEVKNILAIINENNGLLEDLVLMSDADQGVDPERIKKITSTVNRQVARANTIMKNLSRFAHSSDTICSRESLPALLDLMLTLGGRQAAMKNLTTTLQCPEALTIETNILALEALVYLVLRQLIDASDNDDTITLSVSENSDGYSLLFAAPCLQKKQTLQILEDGDLRLLCDSIQGELSHTEDRLQLSFKG